MSVLSVIILTCKTVSLACLFASIYSYHWFEIDNYSGKFKSKSSYTRFSYSFVFVANKNVVQDLCISYGAFCSVDDQMPLPRLIVITPCVFLIIGLLLEIINLILLCTIRRHFRSLLNYFLGKIIILFYRIIIIFINLEQTSIALSCAITIHCIWVTIVHVRISMEMRIIHLHWSFFTFATATILIPIDCICSIARIVSYSFNDILY